MPANETDEQIEYRAEDLLIEVITACHEAKSAINFDTAFDRLRYLDRAVAKFMVARASLAELTWCGWCQNPRTECCCKDDPNGIPEGHWSLEVKK